MHEKKILIDNKPNIRIPNLGSNRNFVAVIYKQKFSVKVLKTLLLMENLLNWFIEDFGLSIWNAWVLNRGQGSGEEEVTGHFLLLLPTDVESCYLRSIVIAIQLTNQHAHQHTNRSVNTPANQHGNQHTNPNTNQHANQQTNTQRNQNTNQRTYNISQERNYFSGFVVYCRHHFSTYVTHCSNTNPFHSPTIVIIHQQYSLTVVIPHLHFPSTVVILHHQYSPTNTIPL